MTTNNTELKKQLKAKFWELQPIAAEKILAHINSLPELTQMNITVRYEAARSFSHQMTWYSGDTNYSYETRFILVPDLEKTFGAGLTVYCNWEGLSLNYGTCGTHNLGTDLALIQKNLLIGILTLHQADIKEFIMNLAEIQEMNQLIDQISEIEHAEWEAEQEIKAAEKKAREEAAAQVKAQKEAEKKAKAAERRKARRAAKKAAQN